MVLNHLLLPPCPTIDYVLFFLGCQNRLEFLKMKAFIHLTSYITFKLKTILFQVLYPFCFNLSHLLHPPCPTIDYVLFFLGCSKMDETFQG